MNPPELLTATIQELTDLQQQLAQLQEQLENRKAGLDRQPADSQEGVEGVDNPSAKQMRQQFANELVPLIEAVPNRPANTPDTWTYKGYMVGIDTFRDVFVAFRDCEAVQICFGLNKPLAEGGQLQLVFRGVGGETDSLFTTGSWEGDNGGGGPVNPPTGRPCDRTQC